MDEMLTKLEEFRHPLRDVDMKKAEAIFEDLAKTREGQIEILDRAKNGDPKAASYLYSRFRDLIARTYITYGEGANATADQKRAKDVEGGFADSMALEAYMMLQGVQFGTHYGDVVPKGELGTSPYNKFDPNQFDENTDLIQKFGYYFQRYFQNHIFKALKAEENDYNMFSAGKRGGEESLDAYTAMGDDEGGDHNAALASEEDTAEDATAKMTIEAIKDYIKSSGDKDAEDMLTVMEYADWKDSEIAEEFGIKNPAYMRKKAYKLAQQYLSK